MRWFGRRDDAGRRETARAALTDHERLVVDTLAEHVPGGRVSGSRVVLPHSRVAVACAVLGVEDHNGMATANLGFNVGRGPFGPVPTPVTVTGYGETVEAALANGTCVWACTFLDLMHAAGYETGLGRAPEDDVRRRVRTTLDGRPVDIWWEGVDRMLGDPPDVDTLTMAAVMRDRLDGGSLVVSAVRAGTLPLFAGQWARLVTGFLASQAMRTTPELKVYGAPWPPAHAALEQARPGPRDGLALLRDLAILVPRAPGRIPPAGLQRTLADIARWRSEPAGHAGWPGWRAHGGRLAQPLTSGALARLDADPPAAYLDLMRVTGPGAGPGYGMLPPAVEDDLLPLAEAGCGVRWVLRLDAAHFGQVWVDAWSADQTWERTHHDVTKWYADWLDTCVRGRQSFTQWDWQKCAHWGVLNRLWEAARREGGDTRGLASRVAPGSITLRLAEDGPLLDPSHACVQAYARLGLDEDVFARESGVPGDAAATGR